MNKSFARRMDAMFLTMMLSLLPALTCAHSEKTDATS